MPSHLIETKDEAADIAKKFHVSLQAAKIRVKELKRCTGEEDVGWEKGTFNWTTSDDPEAPLVDEAANINVHNSGKFVFVAMDFDVQFVPFYRNVIKPIVEECGIFCCRGDEFIEPGAVTDQIHKAVCDCAIVIADITTSNRNVMMEVGMAIATNKPVILICREGVSNADIPYDIQHLRRLTYTEDAAGGVKLRRELGTAVHRLLAA